MLILELFLHLAEAIMLHAQHLKIELIRFVNSVDLIVPLFTLLSDWRERVIWINKFDSIGHSCRSSAVMIACFDSDTSQPYFWAVLYKEQKFVFKA